MNTEEKARAYDEALKWMRELYPGLHGATKEDAEHYFPELRESEDERIRKWILEKMQGYASSGIPCSDEIKMADKAIDYLEKQKEQKPVVTHGETYRVDTLGTQQVIAGKMPQKPAEWSEDYDEENLQTRFAFYTYKDDPSVLYLSNVFVEETSRNHGFGTRILKAAEKVAEAIGAITIRLKVKQDSPANNWYRKHGYAYMTFEDGYDWLEKNLEYMKPNKQEWSEEDKETIDLTIAVLKENLPNGYVKTNPANTLNMGAIHTDELINRLKSLRPVSKESLQPHEEIYQSAKHDLAIKFMNYLDENRPDGKMCLSNAESEDIDKAFKENDLAKIVRYYEKYRPHWKPSEEQMDALKDIAYGTYQNGDGPALRSLYEQLKKLR